MSDFLDKHGAVVILSFILLIGFGTTAYVGMHTHIDPDKLFAWFGGFTMGAFSGLTVAMKVSGNGNGNPPPIVQAPEKPKPASNNLVGPNVS